MSPEMGEYTLEDDNAIMAAHKLVLAAHTKDLLEVVALNRYLQSPLNLGYSVRNYTLTANRLYAVPYVITRARTPDKIFLHVQAADAVNVNLRIGIYNDNGSAYPGTRLTNGGTVSVASIGLKTVAYTTQLVKGLYWIAIIANGVPVLHAVSYTISLLGHVSSGYGYQSQWYIDDTYGNLPDPFPVGGVSDAYALSLGLRFTSND